MIEFLQLVAAGFVGGVFAIALRAVLVFALERPDAITSEDDRATFDPEEEVERFDRELTKAFSKEELRKFHA